MTSYVCGVAEDVAAAAKLGAQVHSKTFQTHCTVWISVELDVWAK